MPRRYRAFESDPHPIRRAKSLSYRLQIDLKLPRSVAVTLFENRKLRHFWQPTLFSWESLSGPHTREGARWRLRHRVGKREISVVETVTKHALPQEVTATYEMPGSWSRIENRFEEIGPNQTRWSVESEFRCKGLMKVVAVLLPKLFKRQTQQSMERFKEFAETKFIEGREETWLSV